MASEVIIKQKEEEEKKLADKIKEAKIVLLADYRGINVADVTELRKKLRGINAEYCVIKNNITRRALAKCNIEGLDESLTGPTAVIIGNEDYLGAAKAMIFIKSKVELSKEKLHQKRKLLLLQNYLQEKHLSQNLLVHYLEIFQNLQLHLIKLSYKKKTLKTNKMK